MWTTVAILKEKEAATAVAFSPLDLDDRRRLAVGLETGQILIYSSAKDSPSDWRLDLTIHSDLAHTDQIHRLSWRPSPASHGDQSLIKKQLASCGEDHTLRVTSVQVKM